MHHTINTTSLTIHATPAFKTGKYLTQRDYRVLSMRCCHCITTLISYAYQTMQTVPTSFWELSCFIQTLSHLPTPVISSGFLTSSNLDQLAGPSGRPAPSPVSLPCSNESTSSQGYHTAKQWKVCFIKKAILPNYRSLFTFDHIIPAHHTTPLQHCQEVKC